MNICMRNTALVMQNLKLYRKGKSYWKNTFFLNRQTAILNSFYSRYSWKHKIGDPYLARRTALILPCGYSRNSFEIWYWRGKNHYLGMERMHYEIIGTAICNISSEDTYAIRMIIYDTKNVVDYTMT